MKGKIRNTYQLMAYLQAQRVLYLLKVLEYIKALKASYYHAACSITNDTLSAFALTNLSMEALGDAKNEILPLYGGIGNKFRIEFTLGLTGAKKDIRIEPIGIIVIGIDGLRQDVLYPQELDKVNDGGQYRIGISSLIGLRQILAGYDQTDENKQRYKMLPEVTAVFPSITLASWASIFTGKMPNETGILGNEFFARDLMNISVPERYKNPPGIISFSSGAFKGYDQFGLIDRFQSDFFVPFSTLIAPANPTGTPQNGILKAKTVYEDINEMPGIKRHFERGGDPVVVSNNHYARGASRWLTWNIEVRLGEAETMDAASWSMLDQYLEWKYMYEGKRNDTPFSELTVAYLPGLDHKAHDYGMNYYMNYFRDNTDTHIKSIVDKLKELGEFDNKLFIITADHGMTEMPTDLTYKDKNWLGIEVDKPADTSCKLNLEFADPENPDTSAQNAELNNNNLHIWEMGEVIKQMPTGEITPEGKKLYYKVLAPIEIVEANKGETTTNDTKQADIIAAMNGPIAHIYVKGVTGWDENPQNVILLKIARLLSSALVQGDGPIPRLGSSVQTVLMRSSLNDDYTVYAGNENNFVASDLRIPGMNHPKRSGDIVLIMKDEMNDVSQRFSTGVSCKSWHGSLNRSDSYVPFIVAYPGGNKNEIEKILQKDILCKTDYSNCRGNWKLTDIVKEIISEQFK